MLLQFPIYALDSEVSHYLFLASEQQESIDYLLLCLIMINLSLSIYLFNNLSNPSKVIGDVRRVGGGRITCGYFWNILISKKFIWDSSKLKYFVIKNRCEVFSQSLKEIFHLLSNFNANKKIFFSLARKIFLIW